MSSKKKIIITGTFLILLIILSMIYLFFPKIEIKLKKDKNITLLVGEEYIESGATAYIKSFFKNENLDINIKGNVNAEKVGKYIITYQAKYLNQKKEIIRIVSVVDNTKPEIILEKDIIGCKKNNLIEFKAKAIDNYDGDISENLKYKVENDYFTLVAKDSSNNYSELKRKIKYIDNEIPEITLKGSKNVYLTLGEQYEEYGATAMDSCDGDLTEKINIQNFVDTSIPNNYEVIYSVKDNNGNLSTITRNVIVSSKNENENKYKVINGATIYLTFDDGPGKYTEELLSILDKYNIKATFFVTNQFPEYQYLINMEYEKGHTVGIHTYTHKWSIYESVESYLEDFNKISNIIFEQTGQYTKIFRFPGGSSNTVSKNYSKGIMTKLVNVMEQMGYTYYDWTFDSGDTSKNNSSTEAIIKNVKSNLKGDGSYVILMHDIKKNTIDALPEIIEYAKSEGYSFDKITENTPTEHFKVAN